MQKCKQIPCISVYCMELRSEFHQTHTWATKCSII